MFKRLFLFLIVNIAVLFTLTVSFNLICALLGIDPHVWLSEEGLAWGTLLVWAAVFGMGGAFISLLMSKTLAKMSVHGARVEADDPRYGWLLGVVRDLADRAGVGMPEVMVYEGSANAFATGAFRNHALVAVSTDLLDEMTRDEVRAVLGHEMAHVANGDMVTLTLLQGVLNACVLFLSRAIGYVVANAGKSENRRSGGVNVFVVYVMQILLGVLASLVVLAYSRHREFAADRGSADLTGSPYAMIAALGRLGALAGEPLPDSLRAFGAVNPGMRASLFASHPTIAARIAALEKWTPSAFSR